MTLFPTGERRRIVRWMLDFCTGKAHNEVVTKTYEHRGVEIVKYAEWTRGARLRHLRGKTVTEVRWFVLVAGIQGFGFYTLREAKASIDRASEGFYSGRTPL